MPVPEPIAIVGIGCRFPGAADVAAFWQLVKHGVDAIAETPADRFDAAALYDASPGARGKIVTRQGGYLREVDAFDPSFFGISPKEASSIDPQQRLLLEVAWEAIEDAGVTQARLAGSAHRRVRRHVDERVRRQDVRRLARHRSLRDDRRRPLRGVGARVLRLRPARAEPDAGHGVLVLARRRAPGLSEPAGAAKARWRWRAA